jgi:hypothetical protein
MELSSPGSCAPTLLRRMRERRSHVSAERTRDGDPGSSAKLEDAAPLPDRAQDLATFLDVCFFATLTTEEGRPTRFACAYLGPDSDAPPSTRRLLRPLPFTPESIRRIAPAIDPDLTCLGVWPTEEGLCIWGLIDSPRLPCLQIFGLETGQLRVSYLRQTQLTYAQGHGHVRTEQDPSFMTSIQLIAAAMGLVTPQWYRPRALLGLADALIAAGHGGAILVSMRPREEVRRHRISLTYPSLGPLTTLEEPVLEAQEAAPAGAHDSDLLKHFHSVERQNDLRRTARLGAVDGAVLVDPHLRIIGFGAMIGVNGVRGSGRVFRVDLPAVVPHLLEAPPDLSRVAERTETPLEEVGGQRHQSAIRWCSSSRSALLALVCSQDGTASLVAPVDGDGGVAVVENIETSPENW